jgi:hypothetical protein
MDEIKLAKENIIAKDLEREIVGVEEIEIDPEIQQVADEIAQDPQLFKNKITIINQLGVFISFRMTPLIVHSFLPHFSG